MSEVCYEVTTYDAGEIVDQARSTCRNPECAARCAVVDLVVRTGMSVGARQPFRENLLVVVYSLRSGRTFRYGGNGYVTANVRLLGRK
jgi:hypothetical protein